MLKYCGANLIFESANAKCISYFKKRMTEGLNFEGAIEE
jgi:hypothetical protein